LLLLLQACHSQILDLQSTNAAVFRTSLYVAT
jgi:hypothetical protein